MKESYEGALRRRSTPEKEPGGVPLFWGRNPAGSQKEDKTPAQPKSLILEKLPGGGGLLIPRLG